MKNEYEVRGEHAVIYLNRRDGSILECVIDLNDLEVAKAFEGKWYAHKGRITNYFYVYGNHTTIKGKTVILHSQILNTPKGMMVDHINGNTLDNRRYNIRNVTQGQNNQNKQGAYKNNKSSGVRGVTWHKRLNKWHASVMVTGKQTYVGQFDTIENAEKAVKEARAKYLPYSQEAL